MEAPNPNPGSGPDDVVRLLGKGKFKVVVTHHAQTAGQSTFDLQAVEGFGFTDMQTFVLEALPSMTGMQYRLIKFDGPNVRLIELRPSVVVPRPADAGMNKRSSPASRRNQRRRRRSCAAIL